MTTQKTKNHTLTEVGQRVFDGIKAAASGMKLPLVVVRAAKDAGCKAFRSNRVYEADLLSFLAENPDLVKEASTDLRARKLMAECVKLEMINAEKRGELIERSWMAERIHRMAGDLNNFRSKSESEHPILLAAAAGDVPQNKEVLKLVWDYIFQSMQSLAVHFEDPKK